MITFFTVFASFLLIGLTLFQIALIAGKPWGRFAWGGQHEVLPRNLRIASVSSLALYIAFALVILEKAELVSVGLSDGLVNVVMWVLTGYFLLGIGMNAISRSKPERSVMTPVAALLFVSFLIVAQS